MDLNYFFNLGDKQSKKLWDRLIELKLVKEGQQYTLDETKKILKNPKIFSELHEATKQDLKYSPLRRIPRFIIEYIDSEFNKILKPIHYKIAGSYLRGKSSSGDIDMVLDIDSVLKQVKISNNDLDVTKKCWNFIQKKINTKSKIIKLMKPFAQGPDKIGVLIKVNIRKIIQKNPKFIKDIDTKCTYVYVKMDIFISKKDEFVFALLFATGSGFFNIRMRAVAKRKGYLLNNHGLFKKNNGNILEKLPINTEKAIFEILNISYKEPKDRIK